MMWTPRAAVPFLTGAFPWSSGNRKACLSSFCAHNRTINFWYEKNSYKPTSLSNDVKNKSNQTYKTCMTKRKVKHEKRTPVSVRHQSPCLGTCKTARAPSGAHLNDCRGLAVVDWSTVWRKGGAIFCNDSTRWRCTQPTHEIWLHTRGKLQGL